MRPKATALQTDFDAGPLIDRACLPDLPQEERDELRALLTATFGLYAEPILRATEPPRLVTSAATSAALPASVEMMTVTFFS